MGIPKKLKYKGETYKAVVLAVISTDDKGRPKQLELIHDEVVVDVREKDTFIIAFTKESNLQPRD